MACSYLLMLQVEASLFSSKFSISRKTTIPSDNTEHKVCMYMYLHIEEHIQISACSCLYSTCTGVSVL